MQHTSFWTLPSLFSSPLPRREERKAKEEGRPPGPGARADKGDRWAHDRFGHEDEEDEDEDQSSTWVRTGV